MHAYTQNVYTLMKTDMHLSHFPTGSHSPSMIGCQYIAHNTALGKSPSIFNVCVCTACVCVGGQCMCGRVIINNQYNKIIQGTPPLDWYKALPEPLHFSAYLSHPSPALSSPSSSWSQTISHHNKRVSLRLNYPSEGLSGLMELQCLLEANQIHNH